MSVIVLKKIPKILAKVLSVLCVLVLILAAVSAKTLPASMTAASVEDIPIQGPVPMVAKAGVPEQDGTFQASVELFGVIPIATTRVALTKDDYVTLGGEPFGIKMMSRGVMVVGFNPVQTADGMKNPAETAGLKEGDILLAMDGDTVTTNARVQELVSQSKGNSISLSVQRKGKNLQLTLVPVRCTDGVYRAGMWVRDSAAGLGTVTFYEPSTGLYGGLGHAVCDSDTGEKIDLLAGETVAAKVLDVEKAVAGTPGAIVGTLQNGEHLGNILGNFDCGVFGTMENPPKEGQTLRVAHGHEVQNGEATLYCSVEGSPKGYACRIEKINLNDDTRNMVVSVTDEHLLALTGGIVQGMSGSPIVQNGMLVGAITHVFVNTPQKGYGVFAETMLDNGRETLEKAKQAS